MNNKPKRILIAVIGVSILVGAGILGFGVTEYIQYRSSSIPIYPVPDHPQVIITSPVSGSQHTLGSPVLVQVTASGPQEIDSVELYINGKLFGKDSAPPGGSHYYQAEFLWSPPEEGVVILIARVIGYELTTGFSSPVQIEIIKAEYDLEAGGITDYPAPVSGFTDPSFNIPLPEAPPLPAEDWKGSLGNWINSLTIDTLPEAPELIASTEGCSGILSIHDLSDNEEGFQVWRILPNSPTWSSIVILASQSQDEWISYTDDGAFGLTTYYVTAFNGKGVRDSNLVSVTVDPEDCAPLAITRSILTLKLESIETLIPVDKFYCYVSLDGNQWARRPEFGFWPGGDALQEQGSFNTEIISLNLTADDGSLEPEIKPVNFYLDCWGWVGDSLHYLGALSPTLDPNQPGDKQFGSDGFVAAVALNLGTVPDQPEVFPMNDPWDDEPELGVFEDEIQVYDPPWYESTIDPTMTYIGSMIVYSPESCKSHLPPSFQNTSFCTPLPGFDSGWEGANPQPYFIWDVMPDMCMEGMGNPPCKPYYYWLSQAATYGHEVGFNIYDSNPKGFYIHHVTTPELFSFVVPVVPCSGMRDFWVQMWYYDGSSLLPVYGPPSNKSSIPCPISYGPKMFLDIRFDEVIFSNLDDGESPPQDVEIYGYLRASSESMTHYLNLADWIGLVSLCPDEDGFITNQNSSPAGCPVTFRDGTHSLLDQRLCRSKKYTNCSESGWDFNNNTIRLLMEESDSLTITVKMIDSDGGSGNDLVCEGIYQIPGQSILDWHKIKNQPFTLTGSQTGSGNCQIKGVMNAVSP